jgi:hypothetical protein
MLDVFFLIDRVNLPRRTRLLATTTATITAGATATAITAESASTTRATIASTIPATITIGQITTRHIDECSIEKCAYAGVVKIESSALLAFGKDGAGKLQMDPEVCSFESPTKEHRE